ncbi:DUF378 domain-containing protein [Neobacillus mesonae]|uniref:DUF378 domain-containing protein n=1 Tax=Neobacillus mesonae TaxID=1193713 RepID=UPI00203F0F2C|nr:DUF378 domain-containing protein [Neobacillus mesonae]MCM3570416.1 DUF378 domain-containing protein [Neobacillus mesonae]
MGILQRIALVLTIIGAINWGLIGFFQFDLVAAIFGGQNAFLSRVVYGLVGISGLACIPLLFAQINDTVQDGNRQNPRNLRYSTEFGEETDLSKLKDD